MARVKKGTYVTDQKERKFLFVDTHRLRKLTPEYAKEVCDSLFEIILKDNDLIDFKAALTKLSIPQSSFYKMRHSFEFAHDFYSMAMTIIGARRETLALRGKLDASIVNRTLLHFDEGYKETQLALSKADQTSASLALSQMTELLSRVSLSKENKLPYKKKKDAEPKSTDA